MRQAIEIPYTDLEAMIKTIADRLPELDERLASFKVASNSKNESSL
jgi:hypothetical protein